MKTQCGMAVGGVVLWVSVGAVAMVAPGVTDGNGLLRHCTNAMRGEDPVIKFLPEQQHVNLWFEAGVCFGFVNGIVGMNGAYQKTIPNIQPLFCAPLEGITPHQGARIIVRYLQTHPERLHLSETVLAIEALRDAFPCAPAAKAK